MLRTRSWVRRRQQPGGRHLVDERRRQRVGQPAQLQPGPRGQLQDAVAVRRREVGQPAQSAHRHPPAGQAQTHHRAVLGPMGPQDAGTRIGCSHPDILESRSGHGRPPRWRWYGERAEPSVRRFRCDIAPNPSQSARPRPLAAETRGAEAMSSAAATGRGQCAEILPRPPRRNR